MADCGTKVCSVEDCDRPSRKRDWCTMHYQRWQRHGDPLLGSRSVIKVCRVNDCTEMARARQLCVAHYRRWRRRGDVNWQAPKVDPACQRCGEPRTMRKDGKYRCLPCRAPAAKIRRRRYYIANADAARRNALEWHEANREEHNRSMREYAGIDREASRQRLREHYAKYPESALASAGRRRARKLKAVCEHGTRCVTSSVIKGLQQLPCRYCGAKAEHADHYVPLIRGGLHCRENLVPACAPCNLSKHDAMPDEWLARIQLPIGELNGAHQGRDPGPCRVVQEA